MGLLRHAEPFCWRHAVKACQLQFLRPQQMFCSVFLGIRLLGRLPAGSVSSKKIPCQTVSLSLSRETETNGTGNLFGETNPTGSRPRDLIGLYTKWQRAKRPQPGELGIGIQQLKRHARSAVAVVMVASSEQANAWRPGREEAVKAMGLVRGMVYSSRRETPTGEKEQQGRGGGRQGLLVYSRGKPNTCG